jgi:hypothetical protein
MEFEWRRGGAAMQKGAISLVMNEGKEEEE